MEAVFNIVNVVDYVGHILKDGPTLEKLLSELHNIKSPFKSCEFFWEAHGTKTVVTLLESKDEHILNVYVLANDVNIDPIKISTIRYPIDDDNRIKTHNNVRMKVMPFYLNHLIKDMKMDQKSAQETSSTFMLAIMYNILYTLQLLNCKNVNVVDVDPNKNLHKRQRRRIKRGLQEALPKYKMLEILAIGRKVSDTSEGSKDGTEKSFHICRGHFRTYTEDKKLFGKIAGTFWIPAHVKGNKEKGEVNKDYVVKVAR